MSMDALTSAALDNLRKNALPTLIKLITELYATPSNQRSPSPELKATIAESADLLFLLQSWITNLENSKADAEISADDAALLATFGGGDIEIAMDGDIEIAMGGDTPTSEELTDADARALLETMNSSGTMAAAGAPAASGDLSDDEAMRMLAARARWWCW